MIKEIWKALVYVLWYARIQRSFAAFLTAAAWLLIAAYLVVSIPQTVEVVKPYEKNNEFNAACLALASEVTPAVLLLIALHVVGLGRLKRTVLTGLALPFVGLTVHFQISYYRGPKDAPIESWELGLVFPFGVIVFTVAVAFLWPLVAHEVDKVQAKIEEALAKERQSWQVIVEEKENQLTQLGKELTDTKHQLAAPDPARAKLEKELAEARQALSARMARPAIDLTNYRERLVRLGKARLNEAQAQEEVDKLLSELAS